MTEDYLTERLLLLRSRFRWRFSFIVLVIVTLSFAATRYWKETVNWTSPFIARVSIRGIITGDQETLSLLKNIEESNASGVLVLIESPGGTTAGSERLYQALRHLSSMKPTVAVVENMAASGAYIAAIGTDHIVALGNSLVGSIGVLIEYPNFGKLLDTVGIKIEDVKSSPLKAAPNGLEPTSPEARAALESLVGDSFLWFKTLVKERRSLGDPQLEKVDDGRVFTGRQALKLGLIDELGGDEAAIAWLVASKGVAKGASVRDWKRSRKLDGLNIFNLASSFTQIVSLPFARELLEQSGLTDPSRGVEGLVSIWKQESLN